MKTSYTNAKMQSIGETRIVFFLIFFIAFSLIGTLSSEGQSCKEFTAGTDTLIVYADVPGLAPSAKYRIRVRSAASNNEWVECFAHYTYNRANELPNIPTTAGEYPSTVIQSYQKFTRGWSQSFANIEMSWNSTVEVEISRKDSTFKIGGKEFIKAVTHPTQKARDTKIENGNIYFKIDYPCQITIDINGQMDDYNKAVDQSSTDQDNLAITYTTHTVALFANPVLKKPSLNDSSIYYVEPGTDSATFRAVNMANYDTMYFKPGIHNIGRDYKVLPGKKYFIPGDAIVYGTFNNIGVPDAGGLQSGQNIRFYGYGVLSGAKIQHHSYMLTPAQQAAKLDKVWKTITIDEAMNTEVYGITVIDPAMHSLNLNSWSGRPVKTDKVTFVRWAKVISWRANGDGIGSAAIIEDCYIHSADDASYVKGDRRRCTFWKDANAASFHIGGTYNDFPIVIEDCDILYNRTRGVSSGGVFVQRAGGEPGVFPVNVTVRNLRVHDKRSNMPVFNMFSQDESTIGSSYKGFKFEKIYIHHPPVSGIKQIITGCARSPWYNALSFDSVMIGSTLLTDKNFTSFFTTNAYVKEIKINGVLIFPFPPVIPDTTETPDSSNFLVDNNQSNQFRIYPNPVSQLLTIESDATDTAMEINIFNTVGQLIYNSKVNASSTQIDVQALNLQGLVMVQVISGNKVSNQKVLIH